MNNKPKKWLAALLGLIGGCLGFFYAGHAKWAWFYFVLGIALTVAVVFLLPVAPVLALLLQIAYAIACAWHSYRLAEAYPEGKPRPRYSRWRGVAGIAISIVIAIVVIRAFLFEPFRAASASMHPTLLKGVQMVVQKWGYGNYGTYGLKFFQKPISAELQRGDIIVFEGPADRSLQYVKRLIGLPGDKIDYRDNRLSINGKEVPLREVEAHLNPEKTALQRQFIESLSTAEYPILLERNSPPVTYVKRAFPMSEQCAYDSEGVSCTVPAGHYYVLGDNRDNSEDSRSWGFVPADHIVGRVVYVFQP